jgi:NitT/TauT family transport system substrate-binding protein
MFISMGKLHKSRARPEPSKTARYQEDMTMARVFDRREFTRLIAGSTALLASGGPSILSAAPLAEFGLWGPPAGPSVMLAHAVATGRLDNLTETPSFTAWRNPNELRAGLTSGQIVASVVPAQLAANLYNRGFPIRLANIMTEGLLYVLSEDASISSIPDLKGRSIAVPFRGDTPEILFTQLLRHHGIEDTDVTVTYVGTPVEAVQLLLAGRVEAAMVVEPAASAAVLRARMAGKQISRVIDITEQWADMTGGPAVLPMAGLALTSAIYQDTPELIDPLRATLRSALTEVQADPAAAASNAAEPLGLPAPVIIESIPNSRLVARDATDIRPEVESMFRAMAGPDLKRVGGALPGDDFYL